jgi:hypothetical protein
MGAVIVAAAFVAGLLGAPQLLDTSHRANDRAQGSATVSASMPTVADAPGALPPRPGASGDVHRLDTAHAPVQPDMVASTQTRP